MTYDDFYQQSYAYDYLGNTATTGDDVNGFYDRSLGTITNGTANAGPHQLKRATITTGTRSGTLRADYDPAGNLTTLAVNRAGPCLPKTQCSQVYRSSAFGSRKEWRVRR